jgi:predicted CXXCH cytochrome family protein
MQCHLETTSRPLPYAIVRYDRSLFSYRPGEPLADYALHFDHAPGTGNDDKFEIAHAAYRLRKSACFQRSDRLTCTTCHDPHRALRGAEAVAHYRTVCRSCHQRSHHSSQDCASCHMPKRRTEDVIHAVMTDHWIQRRRPARNMLAPLAERHDTAETAYRGEVVPYYPERPAEELYESVAQVSEGSNLEAGIPRLESALARHNPAEGMFYFELAEALWKAGQREKSIAVYRQALARRPNLLPARRNFGAALLEMGELDNAAEVLSGAPKDPACLSNLGDVYRRQGRLDAAAQSYREALALDPDLAEAHHGLAQALLASGHTDEAMASFAEAIRIRPGYAEARYNWGTALGRQGLFEAAEKQLLRAVNENPSIAGVHNNLGMIAAARGDLTGAIARFQKALELDPAHAEARANLERAQAARREQRRR